MNKPDRFFAVVLLLAVLAVCGVAYSYVQNTRYHIEGGAGLSYKIDRRTGETWALAGFRQMLVTNEVPLKVSGR